MKNKGFTLIELLAVIVILAIIALIAVPIIINIINGTKEKSKEISKDLYLKAVEQAILKKNLKEEFNPSTCTVQSNGNLLCDGEELVVEVEGERPCSGTITITKGLVTGENIGYCDGTQTEPEVASSPKEWFTFEDNEDGTASVTGLSQLWHDLEDDSKYDIAIPSKSPSGNTVTEIESKNDGFFDDYEFEGYGLTSVIIPDSVRTIGEYAFRWNNITSVIIPDSVIIIEACAFQDNNLKGELKIPNSVTTIGGGAFSGNNLTSVTIPDSVTTIEGEAFAYNKLTSVIISNQVTTIGYEAFYDNKLTSVTIPNSVTEIGEEAFSDNNLTSVTIPNSVTTIGESAFFKDSTSNPNLTKIINKTGREFDWGSILSWDSQSCVTCTVNGVEITAE